MHTSPSAPGLLPRRGILALGLAGLAGCAVGPQPVVLDRAVMAEVKRIAVPAVGFPPRPNVRVLNTATDHFGLIGAVAGAIILNNRLKSVEAMLASRGLDSRAYFQTALAERLTARGLTVLPGPADTAGGGFSQAHAVGDGRDAVLDVSVTTYGFVALNDSDGSPFRPGVGLNTVLVHARDRSVLMRDTVLIDGVAEPVLTHDGTPLGAPTFKDFREIEADPDRAVASLRAALAAAADGVAGKLT